MNSYLKELKKKTGEELSLELQKKQEELRAFRFGVAGSKSKDTKAGRNLRRNIARLHTILRAISK